MSDNLTDLEKKLIVLSNLGITINHSDGHRWINSYEAENYDFDEELRQHGIILNNKIYGSLSDALNLIDFCFEQMGQDSLIKRFKYYRDEISDIHQLDYSRVSLCEKGNGGLF